MSICTINLTNILRQEYISITDITLYQYELKFLAKGIEHITLQEFFSDAPNLNVIYKLENDVYSNVLYDYLDEVNINSEYVIWIGTPEGYSKKYECIYNDINSSFDTLNKIALIGLGLGTILYFKNKK